MNLFVGGHEYTRAESPDLTLSETTGFSSSSNAGGYRDAPQITGDDSQRADDMW